jgi:undecaprenyl pyrophosphate synthase
LRITHVHLYKFHTSLLHRPKKALDFIFNHSGNDFSLKANMPIQINANTMVIVKQNIKVLI